MRRMTTAVAMVARFRVDSVHVLTKDSAVTGVQSCQYGSCLPWQCLFGCSNRAKACSDSNEIINESCQRLYGAEALRQNALHIIHPHYRVLYRHLPHLG